MGRVGTYLCKTWKDGRKKRRDEGGRGKDVYELILGRGYAASWRGCDVTLVTLQSGCLRYPKS